MLPHGLYEHGCEFHDTYPDCRCIMGRHHTLGMDNGHYVYSGYTSTPVEYSTQQHIVDHSTRVDCPTPQRVEYLHFVEPETQQNLKRAREESTITTTIPEVKRPRIDEQTVTTVCKRAREDETYEAFPDAKRQRSDDVDMM